MTLLLLDRSSIGVEDDETLFVEDDEDVLLLLDPFDFADVPLRVTLLLLWMAEDEDSSSFTDVLLSPPQAVKKTKDERLKTRDKVARTCFIGKLLFNFYATDGIT